MKLVKIENYWINPDAIEVINKVDDITDLVMRSNNTITIQQPIEKVLQAIEGSQEHSDDETKSYSFHDENADATLLVNNSTATVNLIDSDGIENLFFKRD